MTFPSIMSDSLWVNISPTYILGCLYIAHLHNELMPSIIQICIFLQNNKIRFIRNTVFSILIFFMNLDNKWLTLNMSYNKEVDFKNTLRKLLSWISIHKNIFVDQIMCYISRKNSSPHVFCHIKSVYGMNLLFNSFCVFTWKD